MKTIHKVLLTSQAVLTLAVLSTSQAKADEKGLAQAPAEQTVKVSHSAAQAEKSDPNSLQPVDSTQANTDQKTAGNQQQSAKPFAFSDEDVDFQTLKAQAKPGTDYYTTRERKEDYAAPLADGNHTLDSKPWGVDGYRTQQNDLNDKAGQTVQVTAEVSTSRGNWAKVRFEDGTSGWTDVAAVNAGDAYTAPNVAVREYARLNEGSHTLDSKPWGVTGYTTVAPDLKAYEGQPVMVKEYAATSRANWAYVQFEDGLAGWVDRNALSSQDKWTSPVRAANDWQRIGQADHTLDSKPWGIEGFETRLTNLNDYYHQNVRVKAYASTNRADWAYIELADGLAGWVDLAALEYPGDHYTSDEEGVDWDVQIQSADHTLDTKPWGVWGFETVKDNLAPYLGQDAKAVKRVDTERAQWVYIELSDGTSGWTDLAAVKVYDGLTSDVQDENYDAQISDPWHTLDTKPWGMKDSQTVKPTLTDYEGQTVHVSKSVSTNRADWVYISLPDGTSGWTDRAAIAPKTTELVFDRTGNAFLDQIIPPAVELASENDLYASVMIAQAALESGWGASRLASQYNNLFGIKGSYQGNSTNMATQEDDGSGNYYTINDGFRVYPSYRESLEDYVDLLKNGLTSNPSFYAGTWKSNTNSYRDATAYLTGRYATDTAYASKLNAIIEANNLTQYDTDLGSSQDITVRLR